MDPKLELATARMQIAAREIVLWTTPSEPPKALQASECSELLDPMRASCLILAQHQPGKFRVLAQQSESTLFEKLPHSAHSCCCMCTHTPAYIQGSNTWFLKEFADFKTQALNLKIHSLAWFNRKPAKLANN